MAQVGLLSGEQSVRLANRFDVLPREERCPDTAADVVAGPAVAPPALAPRLAADGPQQMASWNATALTEQKVHELLDKAVATATLVVAVQEIGAAPAGHVGAWAARYNYCWFPGRGAARARGSASLCMPPSGPR
jgi:hypothetical protein